jgi:hypothetical protein
MNTVMTWTNAEYDEARQALEAHLGPLDCERGETMDATCRPGDILVLDCPLELDGDQHGWSRIPGVAFIYNVLDRGGEYQWVTPPVLRARR